MNNTDKVFNKLSIKYNIPVKDIKNIIESPYEFTRETIKELDLKNVVSEDELEKMKTTFRYLNIGSLAVNINTLKKINKDKWK